MAAERGFLDVVKVLCQACIELSMKNTIIAMFLLQKMGKSAENLDNQKMIFESLGKCLKPSS